MEISASQEDQTADMQANITGFAPRLRRFFELEPQQVPPSPGTRRRFNEGTSQVSNCVKLKPMLLQASLDKTNMGVEKSLTSGNLVLECYIDCLHETVVNLLDQYGKLVQSKIITPGMKVQIRFDLPSTLPMAYKLEVIPLNVNQESLFQVTSFEITMKDCINIHNILQIVKYGSNSYEIMEVFGQENDTAFIGEVNGGKSFVSIEMAERISTEDFPDCVICMTEGRDTLFLPCRHMCICSSCATSLLSNDAKCPICRREFTAILTIKDQPDAIKSDSSNAAALGSRKK